jgi:zinc/manganese transport system substrate-binding protein
MRTLILLFALLVPFAASAAERLRVVTSFSILADITRNIGGDLVDLHNLVGANGDAHTYETSPEDGRQVRQAELIVENGLNFEPWLDRLVKSTETRARVVRASDGVVPRTLDEDGETIPDPHAWNSLANAEIYANNITRGLMEADPAHAAQYQHNHDAYLKQVKALLAEVDKAFRSLPAGNRRIVTSHDAFGYLGQAYGITFSAPQGLSTEREPSAAEVAAIIRQIRDEHIHAVFMENIKDPRLLQQIAEESGAHIGGTLYSDALSDKAPADTYLGLYRSNVETLVKALRR